MSMRCWFGPLAQAKHTGGSALTVSTTSMNAADVWLGQRLVMPKTGTVTHIGFYISAITGTPPAYAIGLGTPASDMKPTKTAFGGSAFASYTPSATGWVWVELPTAASVTAGDMAWALVADGAVAPSSSNRMTIAGHTSQALNSAFFLPYDLIASRASATYYAYAGTNPIACRYDDGTVVGVTLADTTIARNHTPSTTPDEVGSRFTLPLSGDCIGVRIHVRAFTSSDAPLDVLLYDAANTVLKQWSYSSPAALDTNISFASGGAVDNYDYLEMRCAALALAANTVYRLVVKPTGASKQIALLRHIFNAEGDKALLPGGTDWMLTERTDAGAWTDTANGFGAGAVLLENINTGGAWGSVG